MENEQISFEGNASKGKCHLMFKIHKREQTKPYNIFKNWKGKYQIPWLFFFEIIILILYIIFGYLHQRVIIDFRSDFSKVVDNYFLDGFDFDKDDDGKILDIVSIYQKTKFINVSVIIASRFFDFPLEYPCSKKITSYKRLYAKYVTFKKESKTIIFEENNLTKFQEFIENSASNLAKLKIIAPYHMETDIEQKGANINISVDFNLDKITGIIKLHVHHTLIPNFSKQDLKQPLLLISICIIALSIFCLFLSFINLYNIYVYTKRKAIDNFRRHIDVLKEKLDFWFFFSIINHIISIISNITYILSGQNYTNNISLPMILISFSSSFTCILMIKYLIQRNSTGKIVNVILNSLKKLFFFLFGCLFVIIGYLIFGCSILGSYDSTFKDIFIGSETLIAVIHGDSIFDMFQESQSRSDIPKLFTLIFWCVWIFYSLTIVFNISLSIFEEVLNEKFYSQQLHKKKTVNDEEIELESFLLPLPICIGDNQ